MRHPFSILSLIASGFGVLASAMAATPVAGPVMYPAVTWQGRGAAVLRVLNRVDSHVELLTIPVDGEGRYGSLHIVLHRCVDRPPTLAADAAIQATMTDDSDPAVKFDGWMLAAEPSLAVLQSPLYQVGVVSCGGDVRAPVVGPLPTAPPPQISTNTPDAQQTVSGDGEALTGEAGVIQLAPPSGAVQPLQAPPQSSHRPASPPSDETSSGPMMLAPSAEPSGPTSGGPLPLSPSPHTPDPAQNGARLPPPQPLQDP